MNEKVSEHGSTQTGSLIPASPDYSFSCEKTTQNGSDATAFNSGAELQRGSNDFPDWKVVTIKFQA